MTFRVYNNSVKQHSEYRENAQLAPTSLFPGVSTSMRNQMKPGTQSGKRVVVAVPARDEAQRLESCLLALNHQGQVPDQVVLLLNNCTDDSQNIARQLAARLNYQLVIETRILSLETATAGHARRLAVEIAAQYAGLQGTILTTDADATVPRDWVERNVAALNGADLVCGRVTLDAAESARIPAHLHKDDSLECELLSLLDQIAWIVDPNLADPWPRHTEEAGASLGITASALARVGGIPARASGEDRALANAMRRIDAQVRHDPDIIVTVSGRLDGRAAGGMADTIQRRMSRQDIYTDEQVEPAHNAWRRVKLRGRFRAAWTGSSTQGTLADDLRITPHMLACSLAANFFGLGWDWIERSSPVLSRERVRFADLPAEIASARQILAELDPLCRAAAN